MHRNRLIAGFGKDPINVRMLSVTDLNGNNSIAREAFRCSSGNSTIGVQPVHPAVERPARIMQPHFALQSGDRTSRYIGWV
jgi:hypothetical protein